MTTPGREIQEETWNFVQRKPRGRRVNPSAVAKKVKAKAPKGPVGWDKDKCKWGVPGFGETEAAAVVNRADFSASVYVNTSAKEGKTRQAFTYVTEGGYRICVVGHVHPQEGGKPTVAGNVYIPGLANFEMPTPAAAVSVIDGMRDTGAFPGDDRYPHPV